MNKLTEYSVWAWRFRLGFGVFILHEQETMLPLNDDGSYAMFTGLRIFLPFLEFLWGNMLSHEEPD